MRIARKVLQTRLDTVGTALVVVAAVGVGASVVHREFAGIRPARQTYVSPSGPPTYQDDWRQWLPSGIRLGDSLAPITIVEFADFECPFCGRFHSSFVAAKQVFGDRLALVFFHFPLMMHRFARPAAKAAECAQAQGRFAEYHDLLYAKQDSLGLKPWLAFARDAGVRDTSAFQRCLADTTAMVRVAEDLALGNRIGVEGTPTIVINGWRLVVPPYDSLPEVIRHVLAGDAPYAPR